MSTKRTTLREKPTPLGFAILGLLLERPRTGYAVRKVFEESAMRQYSSSPGSIYPALGRLERRNFVEKASEESRSARPTNFFRITRKGEHKLKSWLRQTVTRNDVARSMPEVMLRFALMDQLPSADAIRFLKSLENEISAYVTELEAFCAKFAESMPPMGRLALENGIKVYRAHATWAREAARKLRRRKR